MSNFVNWINKNIYGIGEDESIAYQQMLNKNRRGTNNLLDSLLGSFLDPILGKGRTSSLINQLTQEEASGADKEKMAFNAAEAQKQREWETEMSNSTYQRTVADMQAAGLNPALAYGNSVVPTPQGSTASAPAGNPAGIGTFLDFLAKMKGLEIESARTQSEIKLNEANAGKITKETSWIDTLNTMSCGWTSASIDKLHSDKQLTDEQIENAKVMREKMYTEIDTLISQQEEIDAKIDLMAAQAWLNSAEAWQIYQLVPYYQEELSARSDSERSEASLARAHEAEINFEFNSGQKEAVATQTKYAAEQAGYKTAYERYAASGKGAFVGVARGLRLLGSAFVRVK